MLGLDCERMGLPEGENQQAACLVAVQQTGANRERLEAAVPGPDYLAFPLALAVVLAVGAAALGAGAASLNRCFISCGKRFWSGA